MIGPVAHLPVFFHTRATRRSTHRASSWTRPSAQRRQAVPSTVAAPLQNTVDRQRHSAELWPGIPSMWQAAPSTLATLLYLF